MFLFFWRIVLSNKIKIYFSASEMITFSFYTTTCLDRKSENMNTFFRLGSIRYRKIVLNWRSEWLPSTPYIVVKETLSINALRSCVYIYIRRLSSFRSLTLWFIDLTVATCHIQYTFLSLCQFFREKTDKTRKYSKFVLAILLAVQASCTYLDRLHDITRVKRTIVLGSPCPPRHI